MSGVDALRRWSCWLCVGCCSLPFAIMKVMVVWCCVLCCMHVVAHGGSRSMVGRRCELFRMGLFAGFLNIVTTVHTGEDSSFVYECVKAPATYVM